MREVPNLLEMQKISFEAFLQIDVSPTKRANMGLEAVFKDVFPIESYNGRLVLDFVEYDLRKPRYSMEKCREEELTYSLPLYVKLRLVKKETGEVSEQEVYLGDFPLMTERGSFMVNGAERIIVNQLQRSPGVFFEEDTSSSASGVMYKARIVPERGNWLDFEIRDGLLYMRANRKKRFLATLFLRAMGGVPGEILTEFDHPDDREVIEESFKQDGADSQKDGLLKIYHSLRP